LKITPRGEARRWVHGEIDQLARRPTGIRRMTGYGMRKGPSRGPAGSSLTPAGGRGTGIQRSPAVATVKKSR